MFMIFEIQNTEKISFVTLISTTKESNCKNHRTLISDGNWFDKTAFYFILIITNNYLFSENSWRFDSFIFNYY